MRNGPQDHIKRLEQVIASYGGNPDQWPALERDGLLSVLAKNPHLRAFVQMEAAVDTYLSHDLENLQAPAALTARLQQEADKIHGASSFWRDLFGRDLFRPTAGLVTAALLGVLIGWYSPTVLPDETVSFDDLAISDSLLEWEREQENENG